jgi:molybdopterin/thiamine biosynthesis adenylyltransferase
MFNRSVLALGLDNMRKIAGAQKITIVGVGGLGSIIAEHLIHMGFAKLNLVDFDTLELTNLNRVVGATYKDAEEGRMKVDVIRDHLLAINPKAQIDVYPNNIFDAAVERAIADSDWVMVATDNHASRFRIQQLAFKYFVPFITAGVNITVEDEMISDISGEIILVRMGDRVCLKCLGRLNYNEIAKETHPDVAVREGLIRKGYVSGGDVKEPAVKTLNAYLATMAVDTLVNQYTERRKDPVVLVYEDNEYPTIYEDKTCAEHRDMHCSVCGM